MKRVRVLVAALTASLGGASGVALAAAEYGTVIEAKPVIESVPVVERVCNDEPVVVGRRSSGGGALLGAIVGGVIGHGIGAGTGQAAATALGIVAGTAIGDNAEAQAAPPVTSTMQRCGRVTRYEERVVGYDVVYEYEGSRRTARLPHDPGGPGTRIAVEVQVMPAGAVRPPGAGRRVPPAYAQRDDEGFAPPPWPYYPPQTYHAPPPPVYVAPYPGPYYGAYFVPRIWIGVHHHRRRR